MQSGAGDCIESGEELLTPTCRRVYDPPPILPKSRRLSRGVNLSRRALSAAPGLGCAKGIASIVTSLVNGCWSLFKAALAVGVIAAAAIGVYLYVRMDEEIRRHVEMVLAERLPQMDVNVRGARLIEGKGIAIYDISLADRRPGSSGTAILTVDELLLACNAQATDLIRGTLDVGRVEVKHPQVWLRRGAEGRWNYESLLPLQPCGARPPEVVVHDGAVTIVDESAAGLQPLVLRDIMLTATPTGGDPSPVGLPSFRVQGSLSGGQIKRLELQGLADGQSRTLTATTAVTALTLDDAANAWLSPHLPASMRLTVAMGVLDGGANITWQWGLRPSIEADLKLRNGRIEDPRLPHPLSDATGRITVLGDSLKVEDLRARCGAATVAMSLNRSGWTAAAPMAVAARVDGALLDKALYGAIPPVLREQWDKYRPAGVVDATLQASFDGQTWRPTATLTGRDLAFESDKFPYRASSGSGVIRFIASDGATPPRLDLDLAGVAGGQPIHIVGEIVDPKPGAAGWVELTGKNLTVEDRMLEAMPEKPQLVVTSLHPSGTFDIFARVERPVAGAPQQAQLRLDLTDIRINYDKFPYALRGIRGVISAENQYWTFRDLVSRGRRCIHGEGYLRPTPQGTELSLRFTGEQVPLDEELFDALPEPVQRAWTQLQPRGQVDLTADVLYKSGQGKPNIWTTIRPRPETAQIRPQFFPYLLEKLQGTIAYRDGQVELTEVRGEHDRTSVRTNGVGYFAADGPWQVKLIGLSADRVTPRADLVSALPRQLGKLIDRLQPSGSFSLHDGVLEFRRSDSPLATTESMWDVQLDCHQTDLQCGVELQNVHGSVRLTGQSDGQRSATAGELALETATFQDVQFTEITGPLWIDEGQCLLGRWATHKQGQSDRRLTGKVYGGNLQADGQVTFEGLPKYGGTATISNVDLNRMFVERFGGARQFQGKVDANLQLGGSGYKVESLLGKGDIHIRDANIYELPLLASMLKLLKTGSSDATAFTESDIHFRLQGRHIYLDKLDFLGDVVNLYGKGYANFDQQLNLVFSPVVGRHDYQLPMVKALVGQVNQQIVQMYVDGTLAAPNVTTETLPRINQMLQQIKADLQSTAAPAGERQAGRSGTMLNAPVRQ
jgi:hypothetical protein